MTKLINKHDVLINLYFTLDRAVSGIVYLELINDFDLTSIKIELPVPVVSNERYTLFTITNELIQNLSDGLYTYHLDDANGDLESGSMKIQSDDFVDNTENMIEYEDGDDDFITYDE